MQNGAINTQNQSNVQYKKMSFTDSLLEMGKTGAIGAGAGAAVGGVISTVIPVTKKTLYKTTADTFVSLAEQAERLKGDTTGIHKLIPDNDITKNMLSKIKGFVSIVIPENPDVNFLTEFNLKKNELVSSLQDDAKNLIENLTKTNKKDPFVKIMKKAAKSTNTRRIMAVTIVAGMLAMLTASIFSNNKKISKAGNQKQG